MRYLLDTNTCIYAMKNTHPTLTSHLLATDPSDVAVSAITVFELMYGAAKSRWGERTRESLRLFLSPIATLALDGRDAEVAGRLRAHLASTGSPIGPYDLLIAAQGLSRGLTVVTHNVGEFTRVPSLSVEDWV